MPSLTPSSSTTESSGRFLRGWPSRLHPMPCTLYTAVLPSLARDASACASAKDLLKHVAVRPQRRQRDRLVRLARAEFAELCLLRGSPRCRPRPGGGSHGGRTRAAARSAPAPGPPPPPPPPAGAPGPSDAVARGHRGGYVSASGATPRSPVAAGGCASHARIQGYDASRRADLDIDEQPPPQQVGRRPMTQRAA